MFKVHFIQEKILLEPKKKKLILPSKTYSFSFVSFRSDCK